MTHKFGLTMLAALILAGAGMVGSGSLSFAQTAQDFSAIPTDISAQKDDGNKGRAGRRDGGRRDGGQRDGGRRDGGQRNIGQRDGGQRNIGQRDGGQRNIGQRDGGQRNIGQRDGGRRDIGQRDGGRRDIGRRDGGRRDIGQRDGGRRDIGQRDGGRRSVSQSGRRLSVSIRGANRASIGGRNYSVWRGRHRVRHGNRWRTFVGLGTLGAILIGSASYYPYAYIDAPAPFCEGLTEDGCQLQWQEVPTLEGPPVFQCVAYCPWQ